MFKFENGEWLPYKKKLSFLVPQEAYADTDEDILNSNFTNVVVKDIVLNEEQIKRLNKVKNFENMGVSDLEDYVLNDTMPKRNEALINHIVMENMKELLLNKVDTNSFSAKELESISSAFGEVAKLKSQLEQPTVIETNAATNRNS